MNGSPSKYTPQATQFHRNGRFARARTSQVHSKQEMELLQKGRYLCREIRSTCELEQTAELGATGEMSVKVSPTTTYWLTDAAVQLSEKLGW